MSGKIILEPDKKRIKNRIIAVWLVWLIVLGGFCGVTFSEPVLRGEEGTTRAGNRTLYVGGNGTGNYTSIQDAINASSDDDTVFVYGGNYFENLTINNSIKLIGEGRDKTTICSKAQEVPIIKVTIGNVTIKGFSITHSGSVFFSTGIVLSYVGNCSINNNNITSVNRIGISIFGSNNTISDNIIFDNVHDSILMVGLNNIVKENKILNGGGIRLLGSMNNQILNNIILNSDNDDITITGSSNNLISRNTIKGDKADYSGISLSESTGNDIAHNIIENRKYGIYLEESSKNNIKYNNISNNEYGGIRLEDSRIVTIIGNNFTGDGISFSINFHPTFSSEYIISENLVNGKPLYFYKNQKNIILKNAPVGSLIFSNCTNINLENLKIDSTDIGVYFTLSSNISIRNCSIFNTIYGIRSYHSKNVNISQNEIKNSDKGIFLYQTPFGNITNNKIFQCVGSGIYLEYSSNYNISNNNISFNNRWGIRIWRYSNECYIINNDILSNGEAGLRIDYSPYTLVFSNRLSNNSYGVEIIKKSNNLIIDNIISKNNIGLRISHSSNNTIYYNKFYDNTEQILFSNTKKYNYSNNFWDNGEGEGNYWDDYSGKDSNRDGIGDSPYSIGFDIEDKYPLMKPKSNINFEDYDNDGLNNDLDPHPYSRYDFDQDGLSDDYELIISNSNLSNPDTDGDNFNDGEEVEKGTGPLDPDDYPQDEIKPQTDYFLIGRVLIAVLIIILLFIVLFSRSSAKKKEKH